MASFSSPTDAHSCDEVHFELNQNDGARPFSNETIILLHIKHPDYVIYHRWIIIFEST